MKSPQVNMEGVQFGAVASKAMTPALLLGVLGLVASGLIGWLGGDHGLERLQVSYLFAFIVVTTISLGALFFVLIQHATRAGWSVVVRRVAENIAGNFIIVIPLMFVPVALFMLFGDLYHHWTHPPPGDEVIAHKSPYLNAGFWIVRAVLFLGSWSVIARFMLRHSVAQDSTGDVSHTHKMQWWAPACILIFALSQTFAAIDWVMSLEAHWFSTMFGVYFFAASTCGAFSVLILTCYLLQRAGKLREEITQEHYQDLGKMLFAFSVVFWCYIGYSQYMLIWYANLPEETTWLMARHVGGWRAVTVFLLVGHFFLPFVLLITKHTKRWKGMLALIACWMLFMHLVDMYWAVMPQVPTQWLAEARTQRELWDMVAADMASSEPKYRYFAPHLLDLTCLAGLGGLMVFATLGRMTRSALLPTRDPRLHESLAFENM